MKKVIFFLIMAVIFYGCVTTEPGSDGAMPEDESCVYECEVVYDLCSMGCTESLDGFGETGWQEQCKFNCRKDLNACLSGCSEK